MASTQAAPPTSKVVAGDRAASRARRSRGRPRWYPGPRHRLAVAAAAVLGAGLGAVSLLNAVISQGAFQEQELEVELILLQEKEEQLARSLREQEAPPAVELRARDLGMVPAETPLFLDLSTGEIRGEPVPAATPSGTPSPWPREPGAPDPRLAEGLDRDAAQDAQPTPTSVATSSSPPEPGTVEGAAVADTDGGSAATPSAPAPHRTDPHPPPAPRRSTHPVPAP